MTHRLATMAAAILLAAAAPPPRAAAVIVAASADDVCAPAADPCVVTDTVQIVSGSVLDFGLRTLQLGAGGQLDFAGGSATVLCGTFSATTPAASAISVRSITGAGGSAVIQARGACSGNPLQPCLSDNDCTVVAAGTCSLGDGSLSLAGAVAGNADNPASLTLKAAGAVVVSEPINLDGTVNTATGGTLTVSSARGDVTLDGDINAEGGGLAAGGFIDITAAGNLVLRGTVDLRGGELDGGIFDATAGGDISIENELRLDSKSGEGFGGDLLLAADGDLGITGGTAAVPMLLSSKGSSGTGGFGGDGGEHAYSAGGTVAIGQFVKVIADGAIPDGTGGDISLTADTISLAGSLSSKGNGGQSGGGVVDLLAGTGGIAITASGQIDITGGGGGGGDATLLSTGDITVSGRIDAAGGNGGGAGSLFLVGDALVTIDGTLTTNGAVSFGDTVVATACKLVVSATGIIDNKATSGSNRLTGRAVLTIEAGADVSANNTTGSNTLIYGNAAFPPTVAGNVTPAPAIVLDALLPPCASCTLASECNDDNPCTDDSCDLALGCVNTANTLGCDDGNPCTTNDVCTAGQCVGQIPVACNDGNLCTDDSCLADGTCVNTPNSAPCDDGKSCTTGDTCVGGVCDGQAPVNCADADPCTRDTCDDVAGCLNLAEPALACFDAPVATLQLTDNSKDSKDRLKWKWSKGTALSLADLGSPDTSTQYTLCIYDTSVTGSSVAGTLDVAAGTAWVAKGKKGWLYKDNTAAASGVKKIQLRSGESGKTKAKVIAKGASVPMPTPVAADRFFAQAPDVKVQLTNSEGRCWLADFQQAQKNSGKTFKAKKK